MCSSHRPIEGADSAPLYFAGERVTAETFGPDLARALAEQVADHAIADRLEELRAEIRAERISWGELYELQTLARHIDPSDVELLQWAGVREFADSEGDCTYCGADDGEPCNADCLSRVEPVVAP